LFKNLENSCFKTLEQYLTKNGMVE